MILPDLTPLPPFVCGKFASRLPTLPVSAGLNKLCPRSEARDAYIKENL